MRPVHLLLSGLLALVSCGEKKPSAASSPDAAAAAADPALAAVFTATAPAGPRAIHEARAAAKPGDEIVLSGRVMGADNPFVAGRAAFVLGDPALLTTCNERPGDECPSPWDTCCDTPEAKRDGTATIQVLGADGRVAKGTLEGVCGLAKLARVVVAGKVAPGSGAESLVVNATAIHVLP
jgi:hypothetical protein